MDAVKKPFCYTDADMGAKADATLKATALVIMEQVDRNALKEAGMPIAIMQGAPSPPVFTDAIKLSMRLDQMYAMPIASPMAAARVEIPLEEPMTGLRQHKSASCRLSVPDEPEIADRTRQISDVKAGNPRKGHATGLMHQVCDEADTANFLLILEARPFADGMDQEQLEKWYGKFGFWVVEQEGPRLMARMPGGTPTEMKG